VDPISAPLARAGDIDLVGVRLTERNTALSDTNGTVEPSRLIEKHAMVVESTGVVEIVGRVNDESVVRADGDRRRARSLDKNGEEAQEIKRENRRPSVVDADCTSWHTQTVRADVVSVGEVPPHFVDTCSDREGAREGEQDGRDGSSHCQRRGGGTKNQKEAAWRVLFIEEQMKQASLDSIQE